MPRTKKVSKSVAFQDGEVSYESNLPYPNVYYPGHYGAFLAFSKYLESDVCFCACSISAIENYIRLRMDFDDNTNSNPLKNFILSIAHFPVKPVEILYKAFKDCGLKIINQLNFQEGICHECNKQTPKLSYCHQMYGGVFERNYGWYINRQSFEYGVRPVSYRILEAECPDEVFSLLEIGKKEFGCNPNLWKT